MDGKTGQLEGQTAARLEEAWRPKIVCAKAQNYCAICTSRDETAHAVKSTVPGIKDRFCTTKEKARGMDVAVEPELRHRKGKSENP